MARTGVSQTVLISRAIKGLVPQFYGMCVALDAGYYDSSDSSLASAVWRNVYSSVSVAGATGSGELDALADDVALAGHMEGVVSYIRETLCLLHVQSTDDIVAGQAILSVDALSEGDSKKSV